MSRVILSVVLGLATVASAEPRVARDTADVGKKGSWSVGVFAPLRFAVTDWLELSGHPLLFFVDPNVTARFGLLRETPVRLTTEVGLAVPTPLMRLTQGFLFPSWETSNNKVGWMMVPRAAVLVSGGERRKHVWTALAEFQFRVGFEQTNAGPLTSFLGPLDLAFAAPLTGYVGRLGGAADFALGELFRLRGELNVHLTGSDGRLVVNGVGDVGPLPSLSPWYFTGHLAVDLAVGKSSRLSVGVYYANYDSGASEVRKGADGLSQRFRVRSANILPTVDFIWAGP